MTEITEDRKARLAEAKAWVMSAVEESNEELLSRIHATRDKYLAEVRGLSEAQQNFSPGEGQWSVKEVCLHVAQSLPAVSDVVPLLASGTAPPAIGKEALGRMIEDPGDYGTLCAKVETAFNQCADAIAALGDAPDLSTKFAHPWFGPLNCREWAAFNIMHATVHVRQVKRIKGSAGFPV